MDFYAGVTPGTADTVDTVAFTVARAAEGYAGVALGDHFAPNGRDYPHLWSAAGAVLAMCPQIRVASAFASNLIRSPVEFAHAALTLHVHSGGRFDAGLGAGWLAPDSTMVGQDFPGRAKRARMFKEAAIIAGDLIRTGSCKFEGEHYQIDIDNIGVTSETRPPFSVAVGGRWTASNVSPHADWVELVPFSHSTRDGSFDFDQLGQPADPPLEELVDLVRQANPHAHLSMSVFVAAGHNDGVRAAERYYGDGPMKGLAGEPAVVAEKVKSFEPLGFERISVLHMTRGTYEALAPLLTA